MIDNKETMSGKICMVTGATSGIGAATALALTRMGATVIMVGRNAEKCADMAGRIRTATGKSSVGYLVADLSVQEQIHQMAKVFKERYRRLDVLINNAGGRFLSRSETADGYEMTFALNHLAHFMVTNLLLAELLTSKQGRIINVASSAHRSCPGIDFNNLQSTGSYDGKKAYAQAKLALVYFTYELSRQLDGTGLTVNAVDPGNVLTNFSRNNGWLSWARHIVGSLRGGGLVGPDEGAKGCVYLASSPEVDGITGKYFSDSKMVPSSEVSYEHDAARRLWDLSYSLARFG